VATTLNSKPALLLGVAEKRSMDITRLVFYDAQAQHIIRSKQVDGGAATFAVPDQGNAVYLVDAVGHSITSYNTQADAFKEIAKLERGVDLRDVRLCPLSSKP
jgi:hypothetical protein